MERALERKRAGAAHVLPILLRLVDLELLPFRSMEVLAGSWQTRDLLASTA